MLIGASYGSEKHYSEKYSHSPVPSTCDLGFGYVVVRSGVHTFFRNGAFLNHAMNYINCHFPTFSNKISPLIHHFKFLINMVNKQKQSKVPSST
jgi:hypothetical protein